MGVYFGKKLNYQLEPAEIIKLGEGVNTFNTPFEIAKGECVSSLNTSNRQYPALTVRPGMTAQYGTGATPITSPNGTGVRNGTLAHIVDGTTWKRWDGSAFQNVATGLTNAKAKILEFNTQATRYTILVNGTDKKYYDGTTVSDITNGPATRFYAVDDFRLYGLLGSTIKYSALGSITDWTTVDDAGEEVCVGMIGTGTALVSYNDMIIAFSDRTMHILYGNSPSDFQLMDPIPVGNISNDATIVHEGTLYFMDYNKFKAFSGGLPVDISQNVKGYLESINYTYKDKICAGSWGKYIYLSIPYGASATTNNLTLEYDTELKKWYPWNIGFVSFYNIGQDLYGITPTGIVKKLQQGTADDSTAITWEHITGVWYGSPIRPKKVVSDIWGIVDLPLSSTMNVSYSTSVDGSDWTSLYDFTANANEQNTRIQIPTSMLQNISWMRLKLSGTGPATIHMLEPYVRVKSR